MFSRRSAASRAFLVTIAVVAATGLAGPAGAEALLLVEVDTGKVLHAENATHPWYPASITKIMTAYVTLRAVKEGRITLDKLIAVSPNAVAQQPVKMGFPVGTTLTVDNALKMMMVKSANDIAVVLAEGVGGSIEGFADLMNQQARRLGMTQSHWVNPNGLPADEQITSARDMALLARAALREFPEYDYYWHLPGIRFGNRVLRNYNTLIGRYPGADGMKTGFICASGFNLVATASRDGKRLIAIVLGAPSSATRAIKAAQLLERGFAPNPLAWLTNITTLDALAPVNVDPPNLRDAMCGKHRKRPATEDEDDSAAIASLGANSPYAVFLSNLRAPKKPGNLLQDTPLGEPVVVYLGPARNVVTPTDVAGANPRGKPARTPAVATAAVPFTNLGGAARAVTPANTAPAAADDADTVPLPRVRPKIVVQTAAPAAAPKPVPPPAAPKGPQPTAVQKSAHKPPPKP